MFDVRRHESNPARKAFYEEFDRDLADELKVVGNEEKAA